MMMTMTIMMMMIMMMKKIEAFEHNNEDQNFYCLDGKMMPMEL